VDFMFMYVVYVFIYLLENGTLAKGKLYIRRRSTYDIKNGHGVRYANMRVHSLCWIKMVA